MFLPQLSKVDRLLFDLRKLAMTGGTIKARLALLRQLADAAGPANEWGRDIFEHEKVRLREIEMEIKEKSELSRQELLGFDKEIGQCSDGHIIIQSLRDKLAEHTEDVELRKQREQLARIRDETNRIREEFQSQNLSYGDIECLKSRCKDIFLEMHKRDKWTLQSAKPLFAEVQRLGRELVEFEKTKRRNDEESTIAMIRGDVENYEGDDKIAFYRQTLQDMKERKWRPDTIDSATMLCKEFEQRLNDAISAEEQERIEEIRTNILEHNGKNKSGYLRSVLHAIEGKQDREAYRILKSDVLNFLDMELEAEKRNNARKQVSAVTLSYNPPLKDFTGISQARQALISLFDYKWIVNREWVHADWITDAEKQALSIAFQWYDNCIARIVEEEKARRICHLIGLGLFSMLCCIPILLGVSEVLGIFLFFILSSLPIILACLMPDKNVCLWGIIPSVILFIGLLVLERSFSVICGTIGFGIPGYIFLCYHATEKYIEKMHKD